MSPQSPHRLLFYLSSFQRGQSHLCFKKQLLGARS